MQLQSNHSTTRLKLYYVNALKYPMSLSALAQHPKSHTMKKILFTALIAQIFNITQAQAQQRFPVTTLNLGIHLVQAEVALREEERAQGLMYREKMGVNEGMVFRFSETRLVCMWMKNTPLPLSVAFIDEADTIINIEDMQPLTQDAHCAKKPARYALEMNQGWFKQKNLKPGTKVGGLPK
jgi:uncharacterized membrane protein (UPF0127 family)